MPVRHAASKREDPERVNDGWADFFEEALRLAELADSRRLESVCAQAAEAPPLTSPTSSPDLSVRIDALDASGDCIKTSQVSTAKPLALERK